MLIVAVNGRRLAIGIIGILFLTQILFIAFSGIGRSVFYVLLPGMFFVLPNVSGDGYLLQNAANSVFGGLDNPQLALYFFEGLIVVAFLTIGEMAILAIGHDAVAKMEEE